MRLFFILLLGSFLAVSAATTSEYELLYREAVVVCKKVPEVNFSQCVTTYVQAKQNERVVEDAKIDYLLIKMMGL